MASSPPQTVASRTLRGVLWAYGSYIGGRLLILVSTAILARLLAPREFGVVALALVFIAFLETVADLGLSQALVISDEGQLLERAETVFVANVGLGLALGLTAAALGPVAAAFFHQQVLTAMLPVLGLNFVLRSLGSTHYALAQKSIDFRARTIAEFSDVLVRGASGIILALAGLGAWSLILGYLIGTAALVAALWLLVPWRPRGRPRREHLRPLLRFGGALTGVEIVSAVVGNIDNLFVGRVLGATALGLYSLGYRLPELIIMNLAVAASQVLFPAFAQLDREALRRAFLVALRYTLMVGLPLAAGLAILAEPFTLALFGARWRGSIGAMQLLSLFALAVTVGIPAGTAYLSLGRADIVLKLAVPRGIAVVALLAVFVNRGILVVAACQAGAAIAFDLVGILVASRMLAIPLRRIGAEMWPTVLAAAATSGVLLLLRGVVGPPWPALLLAGAAGALTYLGVTALVARESLTDLLSLLARRPREDPPLTPGGPSPS